MADSIPFVARPATIRVAEAAVCDSKLPKHICKDMTEYQWDMHRDALLRKLNRALELSERLYG
jgi:hypothetical protein